MIKIRLKKYFKCHIGTKENITLDIFIGKTYKMFGNSLCWRTQRKIIQLTFEQHRFELYGFISTQIVYNKYSQCFVSKILNLYIQSTMPWKQYFCIANSCLKISNRFWSTVGWIHRCEGQVWGKSTVINIFLTVWGQRGPIPSLV